MRVIDSLACASYDAKGSATPMSKRMPGLDIANNEGNDPLQEKWTENIMRYHVSDSSDLMALLDDRKHDVVSLCLVPKLHQHTGKQRPW
jgi:hypothetical protein